jgi:hypothetical protein
MITAVRWISSLLILAALLTIVRALPINQAMGAIQSWTAGLGSDGNPDMTRKPGNRARATEAVPFATFAIDFQLALIQEHIDKAVAANEDRAMVEVRKRWARAQGFLSAARTSLGLVSNAQYELDHSRVYPSKPTKRS